MIHIRESGKGAVVVVLSGAVCPPEHYRALIEALARDHRVLFPCFPGYGETPRAPGLDAGAELRMLEDALLARGVATAAVVGSSFGSHRGVALAASGRVRVTDLVLLGAVASLTTEDRARHRQFAQLVRSRSFPAGVASQQFLAPAYAAGHPDAVAEVESWVSNMDPDALADELERIAESEDIMPSHISGLDAPIVARVGDNDVATPVAKSEEIVRHARSARLQIVRGAGHALLIEDFDATLGAVLSHLRGDERRP